MVKFCRVFSGMAKDITYNFKRQPRCKFDCLKYHISHATIKAVQNEVNGVVANSRQNDGGALSTNGGKRGVYLKLSGKEKALVGEYTYNHGVATAIRALDSLLI